jgi:hypothetical protein
MGTAVARRQRRREDERKGHDWEGAASAVLGHGLMLRLSGAPVYGCVNSRAADYFLGATESIGPWRSRTAVTAPFASFWNSSVASTTL